MPPPDRPATGRWPAAIANKNTRPGIDERRIRDLAYFARFSFGEDVVRNGARLAAAFTALRQSLRGLLRSPRWPRRTPISLGVRPEVVKAMRLLELEAKDDWRYLRRNGPAGGVDIARLDKELPPVLDLEC